MQSFSEIEVICIDETFQKKDSGSSSSPIKVIDSLLRTQKNLLAFLFEKNGINYVLIFNTGHITWVENFERME